MLKQQLGNFPVNPDLDDYVIFSETLSISPAVAYLHKGYDIEWLLYLVDNTHKKGHFQSWEVFYSDYNKTTLITCKDTDSFIEPDLVEWRTVNTHFPLEYLNFIRLYNTLLLYTEY